MGRSRGCARCTPSPTVIACRRYPFYFAAIAELELSRGDRNEARRHFQAALDVARSDVERRHLERRLRLCD